METVLFVYTDSSRRRLWEPITIIIIPSNATDLVWITRSVNLCGPCVDHSKAASGSHFDHQPRVTDHTSITKIGPGITVRS